MHAIKFWDPALTSIKPALILVILNNRAFFIRFQHWAIFYLALTIIYLDVINQIQFMD